LPESTVSLFDAVDDACIPNPVKIIKAVVSNSALGLMCIPDCKIFESVVREKIAIPSKTKEKNAALNAK
jgi:hypothetical protein